MEAHSLRICVSVTFVNIRFDSNALAPRHRRTYVNCGASLEPAFRGVSVITVARSIGASMDRLLRYFLGQFIRRGTMTFTTASGARFTCGDGTGRPVSARFTERTDPAPHPPQSRTGARRSLYGRQLRGRERLDRGCAGDPARSARNGAALGQAAMVAALFQPARQRNSIGAAGRKTMSPITTTSTGGCIPSSSTPTGNIVAAISKRRTRRSMMPSSPRNATLPPSS